jgi:hypothetical protein
MYSNLSLFTTCFGFRRPSSGRISYAKTVRLYWMPFLFLVFLSTSHTVVPLYWHSLRLFCLKYFVFKISSLTLLLLFLFLKTFYWGVVHLSRLCMCLSCLYCCGQLLWLRSTPLGVFVTLAPAVLVLFFSVLVFPCCVVDVKLHCDGNSVIICKIMQQDA